MKNRLIYMCFLYAVSTCCLADVSIEMPSSEKEVCHESIVNEKRDYYNRLYPDILFAPFYGGAETSEEMVALDVLLGQEPISLDYEHPADLREELMLLSAERIWLMLQHQHSSAALFKADNPQGWQENICVITLDACAVAAIDPGAGNFSIELPAEIARDIPGGLRLNKKDYIEYVFDHEAYHCLKSMYVGPQRMSSMDLWGEYTHYLNEKGADVYAVALHIKKYKGITPFVENIRRFRELSFYSADPDHHTCDALNKLVSIPADDIVSMTNQEIFELANNIKQDLTISYDEYVMYLAAAIEAIKILGAESPELKEIEKKTKGLEPDRDLVNKLVEKSRSCLGGQ